MGHKFLNLSTWQFRYDCRISLLQDSYGSFSILDLLHFLLELLEPVDFIESALESVFLPSLGIFLQNQYYYQGVVGRIG